MISDLLFRKRLGVPYLSLILILSCLIVSIPTYFSPKLYFVFGGNSQPFYPWQNIISSQFEHGSFFVETKIQQGLPLLVHLLGNLLVIALFGCISERILGTKKFFILILVAATMNIFVRFIIKSYGNGISGIAWSFAPVILLTIIIFFINHAKKLLHDFMLYISIFLFLMMWIIISVGSEWTTNLFHLIATIVGVLFTFIWKDEIVDRIQKSIINYDAVPLIKIRFVIVSLSLPIFLFVVLLLSLTGLIA